MQLDPKLKRLLELAAGGEAPRCSKVDFIRLRSLPGMNTQLQLESAEGADLRSGYILTALQSQESTRAAIRSLFSQFP